MFNVRSGIVAENAKSRVFRRTFAPVFDGTKSSEPQCGSYAEPVNGTYAVLMGRWRRYSSVSLLLVYEKQCARKRVEISL